jgi:predicted Fe-Mo cluster-binding NifX family protein
MKIAVPISNDRISPVFDVAGRLLLVDVEEGEETDRAEVRLEDQEIGRRARRLAELGVDVLICGAVSRPLEMLIEGAGIQVIPHTCGNAEEVLRAYRAGELSDAAFVMPGCCGHRRRFRGGRGGRAGRTGRGGGAGRGRR